MRWLICTSCFGRFKGNRGLRLHHQRNKSCETQAAVRLYRRKKKHLIQPSRIDDRHAPNPASKSHLSPRSSPLKAQLSSPSTAARSSPLKRNWDTLEDDDLQSGEPPEEDLDNAGPCIDTHPKKPAATVAVGPTKFERERKRQKITGESPWAPFHDADEWEFAQWLLKRTTKTSREELLNLNFVRTPFFDFA
jgi:hypothetical protein